jgi:Peptidase A4 family
MRRLRLLGVVMTLATFLFSAAGIEAATTFANPAFQAQWQQGEVVTPNFWGPLANAKDGQQESYKEAAGGQRLVQYFDKGRMELTNGKVTNGLLATELVKGQIQLGDNAFQPQSPPAIPIAGDPDNPGPTYAQLATKGKALFDAAPQQTGNYAQAAVSPTGDISVSTAGPSAAATFTAFDSPTKHNVPKVFADYRTKAGLQTIGYAISEPFGTTVKVAGTLRQVLAQVFERRVLTYTASNPAAFQVEMGNVGLHYYQWRYPNGASTSTTPTTPATSSTGVSSVTPTGNWAGYTVEAGNVTAVHAAWVVPAATAPPSTGFSATWVGIGGVSEESLIQAGTEGDIEDGVPSYYAWVEGLPGGTIGIPPRRLAVNPGDVFAVTITNTGGDNWTLALENRTTGQQVTIAATYTSCKCSADWIEELPEINGSDNAPLANFGVASFTEATATVDGTTRSFTALGAKANALRQRRKVIAQPGAPGGDGASFTVSYVP